MGTPRLLCRVPAESGIRLQAEFQRFWNQAPEGQQRQVGVGSGQEASPVSTILTLLPVPAGR